MYDSKEQSKGLSLAKEEKPKVHDIYNGDKEFVVDEEVVVTNKVTGNQIREDGEKYIRVFGILTMLVSIIWCVVTMLLVLKWKNNLFYFDKSISTFLLCTIVCCICFTIDSYIINKYYKFNIFLYIFSWICNFIYLNRRESILKAKHSIFTMIVCICMLICTGLYGYNYYQYKTRYSMKDNLDTIVLENLYLSFLNQTTENGISYDKVLSDTYKINGISAKITPGGQKMIFIQGDSKINILENGYADSKESITKKESAFDKHDKKEVPTQLVFLKPNDHEPFQLYSVSIEKRAIRQSLISTYWKYMCE